MMQGLFCEKVINNGLFSCKIILEHPPGNNAPLSKLWAYAGKGRFCMWTRHHKRRNTGRLIVPAISLVVLSYFGFHAYNGDYGLNAKARYEIRIATLEAELHMLETARGKLEERVSLVNNGTLEKDMLDEHARKALNLAQANELVIFRQTK